MTNKINLPDIIERTITAIFEDKKECTRYGEDACGMRGDSPIEWAMCLALEHCDCLGMGNNEVKPAGSDWREYLDNPELSDTIIIPQAKVQNYRADFLVVTGGSGINVVIAIECDGHDYHERTKEQARHDKSRDRYFIENGIIVLRFTGSEIYANAVACAEQALTTARGIWFDRLSLRGGQSNK